MTKFLIRLIFVVIAAAGAWYLLQRSDAPPPQDGGGTQSAAERAPSPTAEEPLLQVGGETVSGRWREARDGKKTTARALTPEQEAKIEQLEAIGYVGGSRSPQAQHGVVRHDPDRAQPGFNFYTSGHHPGAILMTMDGTVLHRWERPVTDIWPDDTGYAERDFWRRAWLFPNGDVLAVIEGLGIFKLDKDSNLNWAAKNQAHHDFEVLPGGDILVLTRTAHLMPRLHDTEPILEDFVVRLDADGNELNRVSLIECMENSRFSHVVEKGAIGSGDVFHTNTLHVIQGSTGRDAPWLNPGNLLVCFCGLHMVAAIDLEAKTVLEQWSGPFRYQHDPKILPGGLMMLFDNQGGENGKSRVVEFDPFRRNVHWMYAGTSEDPLYSATLGTAERLLNGNVLIVESDNGRVVEITREGDVVWEFSSPHRFGPYVASIFDMIRLPADFPMEWRSE